MLASGARRLGRRSVALWRPYPSRHKIEFRH